MSSCSTCGSTGEMHHILAVNLSDRAHPRELVAAFCSRCFFDKHLFCDAHKHAKVCIVDPSPGLLSHEPGRVHAACALCTHERAEHLPSAKRTELVTAIRSDPEKKWMVDLVIGETNDLAFGIWRSLNQQEDDKLIYLALLLSTSFTP